MSHYNRSWNSFVRWCDRAFSGGWARQILFLAALFIVVLAIWSIVLVGYVISSKRDIKDANFVRIVELMLDPGAFVGSEEEKAVTDAEPVSTDTKPVPPDTRPIFPVWLQLLITLSGAALFTATMITVFGNILGNRVEDYKKGRVRYHFDDHILVLGGNSMAVNMLKEFLRTGVHNSRKIVILTTCDTEQLHNRISSAIPGYERELDVTLLNGSRVVEATLMRMEVDDAHSIYILGEDDETDHDAANLVTWRLVRKLCKDVQRDIDCYLAVNRVSTYHVFQFGNKMTDFHLHLNIINSFEAWAQRVLVSREYSLRDDQDGRIAERYPAIDRGGIDLSSRKTVRFVICGISQMSYSMATTVAHIAHFPNFIKDPSLRTKICFISPGIKQEMDFFIGHYSNLFMLSNAKYVSWNEYGIHSQQVCEPVSDYGDFLDIEWEFIDTSIEKKNARDLLEIWARNEEEYLTLSLCTNDPDANLAASLYLPEIIYERAIPVFVYNSGVDEVLKYAHETKRYDNVYPFGMKNDSYDPLFRNRLSKAKKINYLYHLQDSGQEFVSMCGDEELDKYWDEREEYVYRFSNLYAANSIPIKLRSIGLDPDDIDNIDRLSESDVMVLAEVEHNRWNIERLLMGFKALPSEKRREINDMLSDIGGRYERGRALNKAYKEKYIHKDLTPYSGLPKSSKGYDIAIVRNILAVMK